eukprot:8361692-Heterocapsa_arctica.AAC.1
MHCIRISCPAFTGKKSARRQQLARALDPPYQAAASFSAHLLSASSARFLSAGSSKPAHIIT